MILRKRYDNKLGGIIQLERIFGKFFITIEESDGRKILSNIDYLERPIVAHINATDLCNFQCAYCYASTSRKLEMQCEEYIRCLDILKEQGVFLLYWSGGEPFCNPHFMQLLQYADSLGFQSVVLTNASKITDEVADELKRMNVQVQVGLNGIWNDARESDPRIISEVKGYRLLCKKGISVIATIMIDENDISLVDMVEFLVNNKIDNIRIGYMILEGKRKNYQDIHRYIRFAIKKMRELRGLLSDKIHAEYQNEKVQYKSQVFSRRMLCCEGATSELYIDSNGDVYPCPLFKGKKEFCGGNVLQDDFVEIWSSEAFKSLRNVTLAECGCEKCNFVCGAWCRGLVLSYTHEIAEKSPFCLQNERRRLVK